MYKSNIIGLQLKWKLAQIAILKAETEKYLEQIKNVTYEIKQIRQKREKKTNFTLNCPRSNQ